MKTNEMNNKTVPVNTNSYNVTVLSGNINIYIVRVDAMNDCGSNPSAPVAVNSEFACMYVHSYISMYTYLDAM